MSFTINQISKKCEWLFHANRDLSRNIYMKTFQRLKEVTINSWGDVISSNFHLSGIQTIGINRLQDNLAKNKRNATGKKSWSEYFFLLSKPARTIPRFQVNQWKGNLSPFTILLSFNCLFSFLSFFAPKDKVNSFISIVKDCPLNRTGVAFQMLQRCFHCCHGCKQFLVVTLPL